MTLSYNDLAFPTYINSSTSVTLNGITQDGTPKRVELSFCDLVKAAELAGLNQFFISDTGLGKTQLVSDIYTSHFGRNGNWLTGRPETKVLDLFEVQRADLSSGKYDSDSVRQLSDRTSRLVHIVDELNRAPAPVQVDFFDLADGKYAFKGERVALGGDGYSLFLATANINKSGDNGFSGTFAVDRALWNRAHLTVDLDHKNFKPTADDKLEIRSRAADPRVKTAEPRDLSIEIIAAYHAIQAATRQPLLEKDIFAFLVDSGLDYCRQDALKEEKQGTFPMKCLECPHVGDICSKAKSASERSVQSLTALAYGLSTIAEMKTGQKVQFSPLDVLLEAYRFTSFHGNLNELTLEEEYAGRRQLMMDHVKGKLEQVVDLVKQHIESGPQGQRLHRHTLKFTLPDKGEQLAPCTAALEQALKQRKLSAQKGDLIDTLKGKGVGADWVDALVRKGWYGAAQ